MHSPVCTLRDGYRGRERYREINNTKTTAGDWENCVGLYCGIGTNTSFVSTMKAAWVNRTKEQDLYS